MLERKDRQRFERVPTENDRQNHKAGKRSIGSREFLPVHRGYFCIQIGFSGAAFRLYKDVVLFHSKEFTIRFQYCKQLVRFPVLRRQLALAQIRALQSSKRCRPSPVSFGFYFATIDSLH